jgi:hypothetical protein
METPTPQPQGGNYDGYIDIPVPTSAFNTQVMRGSGNYTLEINIGDFSNDLIYQGVGWYRNDFPYDDLAQGSIIVSLVFVAVGMLIAISQKARQ